LVTICYTDPPSTPGASHVLVNDLDLIVQMSTTEMVLNTSIGKKVPTQSFIFRLGNGGPTKDGSNTCEKVVIPSHGESTITVAVVAFRLVSPMQEYSLVVSGLTRPKYHFWITTLGGRVRKVVLDASKNGVDMEAGWLQFDLYKRQLIFKSPLYNDLI
jgi:hypothetical protein